VGHVEGDVPPPDRRRVVARVLVEPPEQSGIRGTDPQEIPSEFAAGSA